MCTQFVHSTESTFKVFNEALWQVRQKKEKISEALKLWLPRETVKEVAKRSCLKDGRQRQPEIGGE
jgi:hypothetical protein